MSIIALSEKKTLSDYYPACSVYFYGYPAGDDSNFYNGASPFEEELVSGRPLICAGDKVKVLTFSANADTNTANLLSKNVAICSETNIIKLPDTISADVVGNVRNRLIKEAILELVEDGKLIMAQPFLDENLEKKFNIPPNLAVAINDKKNRLLYIPDKHLPQILATFNNGKEFSQSSEVFPLPCVIKVTSSRSGNGVQICKRKADIAQAKKRFARLQGDILIEEYIEYEHSLCMQVGIPYDTSIKPTIIGYNESLISPTGDFLAGIVNYGKQIPHLKSVVEVLEEKILPKVRKLGWYGIAGIEVLIKADGTFYFIDPNFRLTATYPFIYLTHVRKITSPIVSFMGTVTCTPVGFANNILPFATTDGSYLTIVSLTKSGDTFRFNAGIQFDSIKDLRQKADRLQRLGIESLVLRNILQSGFAYSLE